MALQAVLNRPTQTIKVKKTDTGFTSSATAGETPVTLQNADVRFDQMADVDESNATNNSVPVYNAQNDKYEVKQLELDGGSF
jgi:hypothetical protein